MALKGISKELRARRTGEYKVGPAAAEGMFFRLGSANQYVQLASINEVTHVSEWAVTAAGIEDTDILKGVEVRETQVNMPARLIELQPGDLVRTDQLASGADTGAFAGSDVPGAAVSFYLGKARKAQTNDTVLAEINAGPSANKFDTDGTIELRIVRLR